jgi:hypothetical protein
MLASLNPASSKGHTEMIANVFHNFSCDPLVNLTKNLEGRMSSFADPRNLRKNKQRVLSCRPAADGLLLGVTISDSKCYSYQRQRCFKFLIFGLLGNVVARTPLNESFRQHNLCVRALDVALGRLNAIEANETSLQQHRMLLDAELGMVAATIGRVNHKRQPVAPPLVPLNA